MLFLPSTEPVIKKWSTHVCTAIFPGTIDSGYLFYITLDYIFVHDIFCKSIAIETDFGGHMVSGMGLATCLVGLQVGIPLWAWISVSCECVCCQVEVSVWPITCPEESY
jgi:hypothetical protein